MIALITGIRKYIADQDGFLLESCILTAFTLLGAFAVTYLLDFQKNIENRPMVQIELKEYKKRLTPLELARKDNFAIRKITKNRDKKQPLPLPQRRNPDPKPKGADISALVKIMAPENMTASPRTRKRKAVNGQPPPLRITNRTAPQRRVRKEQFSNTLATPGTKESKKTIYASSTSVRLGKGVVARENKDTIARGFADDARRDRSLRQLSVPAGAGVISLKGADDKNSMELHLLELIKWMKRNPGTIPKLVGYDMGHITGEDLQSDVTFRVDGKPFTLFLSCNARELLLRICLVSGTHFTLLKDNGIRKSSNFLTHGEVMRQADRILSLISSRRAPADKALTFYSIFWKWWDIERRKI